jgi:hypothetical protein
MVEPDIVIRNFSPRLPVLSDAMTRRDLLPGVSPDPCFPASAAESHRAIRRARVRAAARDISHILLLVGIDYLFFLWPSAHVPTLDRGTSAFVLAALNSMVMSHILLSRLVPRMTAKRIAATWCLRERARFFQAGSR